MRLRSVLAVIALVAGVFLIDGPDSWARTGNAPWCAVVNLGAGGVSERCDFRTLEECVPHVIAGNRGFCNQNPGYEAKPARHRAKKPR